MSKDFPTRWWINHLRRHRGTIFISLVVSLSAGAVATLDPLFMRRIIDTALPGMRISIAMFAAAGLALCFVGRSWLNGISSLLAFKVTQMIGQDLRYELLAHMTALSADWHDQVLLGEKLSRFDQDAEQIAQFSSDVVNSVTQAGVFFIVNALIMLSINWQMTLSVLPLLPLFLWVRAYYRGKIESQAHSVQSEAGRVTGIVGEHLGAVPQTQLLSAENIRLEHVFGAWRNLFAARLKQRWIEVSFSIAVSSILTLAILGVLTGGIWEYRRGALTIGGLVAFYAYVTRLFDPISTAMEMYSRVQRVTASVTRIHSVLDQVPTVADDGRVEHHGSRGSLNIECSRVFFAYRSGSPVLRDITLSISKGERVALIGRSGSGKSTLSRLIVRLTDPTSGVITMGPRPLAAYTLQSLRKTVCYLPQQPILFSGTFRENLLFGNSWASESEIQSIIDIVQLRAVLERLPNGLDSCFGPGAYELSGGERQRFALARGLLRRSPILILDESTSALDLPTETAVLRSIASLQRETTLILISHRLRSLTWVDRLILLECGSIQAQGSHQELYRVNALYRSLYERTKHVSDIEEDPSVTDQRAERAGQNHSELGTR